MKNPIFAAAWATWALACGAASSETVMAVGATSAPPDSAVSEAAIPIAGVEVTATRLEADPRKNAARVDVIEPQALGEFSNSSAALSEWVAAAPGIGALGRDPFTSAPTIRGLGRGRSLVLVEGINISSDRGVGPGLSFVEPALVKRIEIVRGASGVAYGSGAMGGVMSIELGAPGASPAQLRVGNVTNGDERHAALSWKPDALGGFVGGSFRTRDDYSFPTIEDGEAFDGEAKNSGGEVWGGAGAVERPWQGGTLRLAGLTSFTSDLGRAIPTPNRLDSVLDDDHVLGALSFRRSGGTGRRLEARAGLHRTNLVNRSDRFDGDTGLLTRRSDTVNESLDLTTFVLLEELSGPGSWIGGGDVFMRTGVEANETTTRFSNGVAGTPNLVNLVESGLQSDVGAFAGYKFPVGPGQLLLAARGDWSRRSASNQETTEWVSPSVNASLTYPLSRDMRVSGIVARTYRAPQIQELYFEGNRPSGYRLPNPDLDPETALSLEGGVDVSRRFWGASAAVWGFFADDLIAQLPVDDAGDTLRFENVSQGTILGAEFGMRWMPGENTEASIEYAFLHGEDEDGDPLPDIPAGEATLSARQRLWDDPAKDRGASARCALRVGGAKTPIADGSGEGWWSPIVGSTKVGGDEVGHRGYALWDLGATWQVRRGVAFDVAVTNLLDARQIGRPEPDAFPDPGRSLNVELRLGE